MTYPTRGDKGSGFVTENATSESDDMLRRWSNHPINRLHAQKPRLDWLLLLALTLDVGAWVGLLAWWIWR